MIVPRYPVYVPSKGRAAWGHTVKFLVKDQCPFYLVVEPQEEEVYRRTYPGVEVLVLPEDNMRLIGARNWIKGHATAAGYERHWQVDDNIRCIKRRWHGKRIPCQAGVAFRVVEDFADRYENVAIAGMAYEMFVVNNAQIPPFWLNVHVYSCTLVLNKLPLQWRTAYNDDTDLCLQALVAGWCTVWGAAVLVFK